MQSFDHSNAWFITSSFTIFLALYSEFFFKFLLLSPFPTYHPPSISIFQQQNNTERENLTNISKKQIARLAKGNGLSQNKQQLKFQLKFEPTCTKKEKAWRS